MMINNPVQIIREEPPKRRTRTSSRRLSQPTVDDSYVYAYVDIEASQTPGFSGGGGSSGGSSKRRRNSSEHSIISTGSYDDPESPYKRKRRRYEEEPSDDPAFEKSRKNAIIAKRNREKKKQMMEQMESRCEKLSAENEVLDADNSRLRQRVETLEEEVYYLKSVLANQSALSQVLSSLKSVDNLRFSTSFEASKFKNTRNQQQQQQQLKVSGGICLHVDGAQVSMEMCQKCAQMACGAARSSDASGKIRRAT